MIRVRGLPHMKCRHFSLAIVFWSTHHNLKFCFVLSYMLTGKPDFVTLYAVFCHNLSTMI